MFRPVHFAAREPVYHKLIEALVPYEKIIKSQGGVSVQILDAIMPEIWNSKLRKSQRDSLRVFVRNNKQSILKHINEKKRNKEAVVVHRSVEARERFFESVATALIPYKDILQSNPVVPMHIVESVAELVDGIRVGQARRIIFQGYLRANKDALLRRISQLNEKADESDQILIPEMKIVILKIESLANSVSSPFQNHQEDIEDFEAMSQLGPQSLPCRKRNRELDEYEENEIIEQEHLSSSPCPKRRRIISDDLEFARWCLNQIRPVFGA